MSSLPTGAAGEGRFLARSRKEQFPPLPHHRHSLAKLARYLFAFPYPSSHIMVFLSDMDLGKLVALLPHGW